ncbi:AtpZ/AtpI family protein [Gelidibacter japonicus]|jgi:F0F1-type ATP synthase assembly protein I|uniref:AtpZ/AtpI family protein n=1 Tax=Gelidibacter japonicus TaxID=1962232 RepID=UPI0013CF667F|nr:AtpZ/AtpI family protein [Gelidibacter japonicus]MCL8008087.1 AtpZ/AtpI family protein [Gelidibacter japonicus]
MPNQPKKDNPLNSYAKYSSIAIQMFAIIGIGSFIGVKIDDHYGNENNLWTIILSLTSTIVAVVFVIRRIIANSKDEN